MISKIIFVAISISIINASRPGDMKPFCLWPEYFHTTLRSLS